jgi:hypothetical protein
VDLDAGIAHRTDGNRQGDALMAMLDLVDDGRELAGDLAV